MRISTRAQCAYVANTTELDVPGLYSPTHQNSSAGVSSKVAATLTFKFLCFICFRAKLVYIFTTNNVPDSSAPLTAKIPWVLQGSFGEIQFQVCFALFLSSVDLKKTGAWTPHQPNKLWIAAARGCTIKKVGVRKVVPRHYASD